MVVLLAACSEPAQIGVIAPLTGPIAVVGEHVRDGAMLASPEVIVEDSACKPKEALNAIQKLAEVDGVKIIIGPFCSGNAIAAVPLAEEKDIVLISPGALAPQLSGMSEWFFRVTPSDVVQAQYLSEVIAKEHEDIAVLYLENEWGVAIKDAFAQALPKEVVASESIAPEAIEARTQLLHIKEANPTAIVIFVYPNHYALISKQVEELGIKAQLYATHTFETPTSLEMGSLAERYIYTMQQAPQSEELAKFEAAYQGAYQRDAVYWAALAYDATVIATQALDACDKDTSCIRQYLHNVQEYKGASGIKSFDENGDQKYASYALKTVRNNTFVAV